MAPWAAHGNESRGADFSLRTGFSRSRSAGETGPLGGGAAIGPASAAPMILHCTARSVRKGAMPCMKSGLCRTSFASLFVLGIASPTPDQCPTDADYVLILTWFIR